MNIGQKLVNGVIWFWVWVFVAMAGSLFWMMVIHQVKITLKVLKCLI